MEKTNTKSNWFQKLIVPGVVFQSCVIAGGYGTGRELVEYFMGYGPVKGTMAICIITFLVWGVIAALTFMFAILYKKFDYKSIMKELMGPASILYEAAYLFLLLIIMGVVTSAAGSIVNQLFGWNNWIGIIGMAAAIFILVINGSDLIEKVLSVWSFVLYAVYIIFLIMCFANFGDAISESYAASVQPSDVGAGWLKGGFMYAFYNMAIILSISYTLRHNTSHKTAGAAGIIAGAIGILPGIILFIAMCAFYPEISGETLPIAYMIDKMNIPWFQYVFQIVLFGTLIETGSGLIYSVTDRLEIGLKERGKQVSKWHTPAAALIFLAAGCIIAQFGLISLVAKGYGTCAWIMFFVYCIPMITVGVYKIRKKSKELKLTEPA